MEKLIDNFTEQLNEALEIGRNIKLNAYSEEIRNVLICGLGGSGIGASLVENLTKDSVKIPITICKAYTIPAYVNKHTLVIISSYSGNTEETVACFEEALKLDCKIVCVSSNGQIETTAKSENLDFIKIPGGMPPRACLGYSSVQLFFILNFFNIIEDSFEVDLEKSIKLLDSNKEAIKKEAKELADKLIGKTPIIYSADNFDAVAVRFRQQLNENSKMLGWNNAIPEMNHNELVGWRIEDDFQAVILLRNVTDLKRIQSRMELNKQIISKCTKNIYEVWSKGENNLQRAYYLIHLTDWVTLYLSFLRGVDTTEVNVIDFLKGKLASEA